MRNFIALQLQMKLQNSEWKRALKSTIKFLKNNLPKLFRDSILELRKRLTLI